ncbi:TadE family protein [Pseudomonas sp. OHS18]|uniref:TadE family protein n=1 Tax=Pseudomonas sp. OHS18 TaxID=3399679 RepID=UPI003A89206C
MLLQSQRRVYPTWASATGRFIHRPVTPPKRVNPTALEDQEVPHSAGSGSAYRQRGAAAVEFSIAFIIFFLILYGLVGYSIPFLLSATYQELATEALRDAIRSPIPARPPQSRSPCISNAYSRACATRGCHQPGRNPARVMTAF